MSKMRIPGHIPANAERFKTLMKSFLDGGGLRRVLVASEPGVPGSSYEGAGLTRVPFLIVCIDGSIDIHIMKNGKPEQHVLHSGEGIFLASDTWISCIHYSCRLYFRITIDTDHTLYGAEEKQESAKLAGQFKDRLELYVCPRVPEQTTLDLVKRIEVADEHHRQSPWLLHAVNLLLTELFLLLHRDKLPLEGKAYKTWLSIRNYLQEYCNLPLDRKNVAKVFGVTPNHVSRLFHTHSGPGFNESLQHIRLTKAAALLRSSHFTIAEIGYQCGFSSSNYFIRSFRNHFGRTPGSFRDVSRPNRLK